MKKISKIFLILALVMGLSSCWEYAKSVIPLINNAEKLYCANSHNMVELNMDRTYVAELANGQILLKVDGEYKCTLDADTSSVYGSLNRKTDVTITCPEDSFNILYTYAK